MNHHHHYYDCYDYSWSTPVVKKEINLIVELKPLKESSVSKRTDIIILTEGRQYTPPSGYEVISIKPEF